MVLVSPIIYPIILTENYDVFGKIKDIYLSFIEKAFLVLCRTGLVSFIVPSAWAGGPAYEQLRIFLRKKKMNILLILPFDIFPDAYIDTLIFNASNLEAKSSHLVKGYAYPKKEKIISIDNIPFRNIPQIEWEKTDDRKFIIIPELINLLSRLSNSDFIRFQDVCSLRRGVLFNENLLRNEKINNNFYPYFQGDVYRYKI